MDRFTLAPVEPSDLAQDLHRLWQAAYSQEAAVIGVPLASFLPLRVGLRDLVQGGETWLGCSCEGELVGALAWGADDQDPTAQQISALIVDPDWQRQGVATRLLHALSLLAGRGPVVVHVAAANEPALALLEGRGFRRLHRWLSPEGVRMLRLQWKAGLGD